MKNQVAENWKKIREYREKADVCFLCGNMKGFRYYTTISNKWVEKNNQYLKKSNPRIFA